MNSRCGLHIPPKSSKAKPRSDYIVHNIKEIQQTIFCLRANKSKCCDIACYRCLFQADNITLFVSWYRERKLMCRSNKLVNTNRGE